MGVAGQEEQKLAKEKSEGEVAIQAAHHQTVLVSFVLQKNL